MLKGDDVMNIFYYLLYKIYVLLENVEISSVNVILYSIESLIEIDDHLVLQISS